MPYAVTILAQARVTMDRTRPGMAMRALQAAQHAATMLPWLANARLESWSCRRCCQAFSCEFNSGEHEAERSRLMLPGTSRRPPVRCQVAQARKTVRVAAMHPAAQGLPVPAANVSRFGEPPARAASPRLWPSGSNASASSRRATEAPTDPAACRRNAAAVRSARVIATVMSASTLVQANPTTRPQAEPTHV